MTVLRLKSRVTKFSQRTYATNASIAHGPIGLKSASGIGSPKGKTIA